MAELRIGTATSEPAAGKLKIGSNNIQEIYLGSTKVWPSVPLCPGAEEVQIGNLIWKTANTDSLATDDGDMTYYSQISSQLARDSYTNEEPIATQYQGGASKPELGRYYNKYAAKRIIPPTGFRLPTDSDIEALNTALIQEFNETSPRVTSIAGGEDNAWADSVKGNFYFGRSCFNSLGAGFWRPSSTGNSRQGQNNSASYWTQEQADLTGTTNQLKLFAPTGDSTGSIEKTNGFTLDYTFAPIRFCKDAPTDEVQIGDLIWTTTNSTIVASSGGTIPILTNAQELEDAFDNSTPGAIYYDLDSANAGRGLLYNPEAAAAITPPTGFRLPTVNDWLSLTSAVTPGTDVTAHGGGANALWNQTIKSNAAYGSSGFNATKAGVGRVFTNSGNFLYDFTSDRDVWWNVEAITPRSGAIAYLETQYIISQQTFGASYPYWAIRFCKDA